MEKYKSHQQPNPPFIIPCRRRTGYFDLFEKPLWMTLFIKVEKCKFHVPSVKFLGYIIESGQVNTDPEKIQAVAEWPTLTTRKQLQQF